jgi:hypothetical protein
MKYSFAAWPADNGPAATRVDSPFLLEVMVKMAGEHDPCDPLPSRRGSWIQATSSTLFNHLKALLRAVVCSIDGFWAKSKYIGTKSLEYKLKKWMKTTVDPLLVDTVGRPLPLACKEALRYRRQAAIHSIWNTYKGQ